VEEPTGVTPTAAEIQAWIVAQVSRATALPAAEIDAQAPFTRYGLDSVAVILLAADLEKWLDYRFRKNPLGEHPTIEALARFLAEEVGKGRAK
jgi:acyl carrier protein